MHLIMHSQLHSQLHKLVDRSMTRRVSMSSTRMIWSATRENENDEDLETSQLFVFIKNIKNIKNIQNMTYSKKASNLLEVITVKGGPPQ